MYASITFLSSAATASDTTGTPGGPSDAVVIGIPTVLVSLLGIIVGALVTIWGVWYANKKKGNDPSKWQLLTHSTSM